VPERGRRRFDQVQDDADALLLGNPYISTKRATMKAEKLPNVRQSRWVFGLKKLKAKKRKIADSMMTSDHRPYACTS
jgi:hypothetical protein